MTKYGPNIKDIRRWKWKWYDNWRKEEARGIKGKDEEIERAYGEKMMSRHLEQRDSKMSDARAATWDIMHSR